MEHNYNATIGALLIGFSIACVIFGVLTQQAITYHQRYFHDKWSIKILVGALWLLEFISIVLVGHTVYYYTITHFGDFVHLLTQDVAWSLIPQVLVAALAGTIVKCKFAVRVWAFSKRNYYILGLIAFLILGQAGFTLAYCIKAFQYRKLRYASRLRVLATLSLAVGVLTDITIALALCYFLRKLRTGLKKSDSLVNMLCIYAINTGVLTSAVSATVLVLYNTNPHSMYFVGAYFVLGQLYAISFICTLNTRSVIRGKGTDQDSSTGGNLRARSVYMSTNPSGNEPGPASPTSPQIGEIGLRREISPLTDIESCYTKEVHLSWASQTDEMQELSQFPVPPSPANTY